MGRDWEREEMWGVGVGVGGGGAGGSLQWCGCKGAVLIASFFDKHRTASREDQIRAKRSSLNHRQECCSPCGTRLIRLRGLGKK